MASAASLLLDPTSAVSSLEKRVATRPPTKKASSGSWLLHLIPATLRPYADLARVHRSIAFWLVAWPQLWGIALATPPGRLPDLSLLWMLAWVSFFEKGLACTIDDIFDRDLDAKDKKDDVKAGVKSVALMFGESTKSWISGFGVATITFFLLTGYTAGLGWPYYAFLAVAAAQLVWQIWTLDISRPENCFKRFESNQYFGAFVFLGILTGKLVQ
ncbi:4-hydroxybenzoate geranyltransferase 2-like [Nymphaea colorata]|nr:4-hydroxybenzoate geranyltransferase 2-like [Nymphaea colorata]